MSVSTFRNMDVFMQFDDDDGNYKELSNVMGMFFVVLIGICGLVFLFLFFPI